MSVQFWPRAQRNILIFTCTRAIVGKPMNPISPSSMNEQERKMLQEVIEISSDNNAMLRKLVRAQRSATLWKLIYWTIIIGSIIAGYYSIQPYIEPLMQAYSKVMGVLPK